MPMKFSVRKSATLIAIIFFNLSLPGQAALAAGWTDNHQINIMTFTPAGDLNIWFTGPHNNPDGCAADHGAKLDATSQFFDNQMAMLMLAFANKIDVKLYLSGCDAGTNSKPLINWIQLDRTD